MTNEERLLALANASIKTLESIILSLSCDGTTSLMYKLGLWNSEYVAEFGIGAIERVVDYANNAMADLKMDIERLHDEFLFVRIQDGVCYVDGIADDHDDFCYYVPVYLAAENIWNNRRFDLLWDICSKDMVVLDQVNLMKDFINDAGEALSDSESDALQHLFVSIQDIVSLYPNEVITRLSASKFYGGERVYSVAICSPQHFGAGTHNVYNYRDKETASQAVEFFFRNLAKEEGCESKDIEEAIQKGVCDDLYFGGTYAYEEDIFYIDLIESTIK